MFQNNIVARVINEAPRISPLAPEGLFFKTTFLRAMGFLSLALSLRAINFIVLGSSAFLAVLTFKSVLAASLALAWCSAILA